MPELPNLTVRSDAAFHPHPSLPPSRGKGRRSAPTVVRGNGLLGRPALYLSELSHTVFSAPNQECPHACPEAPLRFCPELVEWTVERGRPPKTRPRTAPSSPYRCHAGATQMPCRRSVTYLFCHGLTTAHRYATASISISPGLLTSPAHPCYRLPITHLHNLPPTANRLPRTLCGASSGPPARCAICAPFRTISVTVIARFGTHIGLECHLSQLRKGQDGAIWGTFSDFLAPRRPSRMTVE